MPKKFTLGTGHVKFFYNKLGYLFLRYCDIYSECVNRGFKVTNYWEAWVGLPDDLLNDYEPTDVDRKIIRERIQERLNKNDELRTKNI